MGGADEEILDDSCIKEGMWLNRGVAEVEEWGEGLCSFYEQSSSAKLGFLSFVDRHDRVLTMKIVKTPSKRVNKGGTCN